MQLATQALPCMPSFSARFAQKLINEDIFIKMHRTLLTSHEQSRKDILKLTGALQ
jgi:hypothetical protein